MQPSNSGGLEPRFIAFLLALAMAWAAPAFAFPRLKDSSSVAADLSRAASRHGRRRVAVVPFRDPAGNPCRSGAVVAERLIEHFLKRGGVEVVERSQLEGVLREHQLGSSGALDPATAKRLGRFLGVEAVVTGTIVELLGDRVEVHARLIDVETARILSASMVRIEKDWSDFDTSLVWVPLAPPVPFFPGDRQALEWHDSLNAGPSSAACDTSDERVLEARARYWARRLRDPGFSTDSLRANPGSEIVDARLRERFYSRLRMWYEDGHVPPLSEAEQSLIARCP